MTRADNRGTEGKAPTSLATRRSLALLGRMPSIMLRWDGRNRFVNHQVWSCCEAYYM